MIPHRTPSQRRADRAAVIAEEREREETRAWVAANKLPGESDFDFTMRMQERAFRLYEKQQREYLQEKYRPPRVSDGPFIHIRKR